MNAAGKLITAAISVSIFGGFLNYFQPLDSTTAQKDEKRLITAEQIEYDWQPNVLSIRQFKPISVVDSQHAQDPTQENKNHESIDPNDITKAALVGIFVDEPQKVIIVVAALNSDGLAVNTENTNTLQVSINQTILDGWKLVDISSDKVLWHHEASDKSYLQHLFSPTSDNKITNQ